MHMLTDSNKMTFKKDTIISSSRKAGLWPIDLSDFRAVRRPTSRSEVTPIDAAQFKSLFDSERSSVLEGGFLQAFIVVRRGNIDFSNCMLHNRGISLDLAHNLFNKLIEKAAAAEQRHAGHLECEEILFAKT